MRVRFLAAALAAVVVPVAIVLLLRGPRGTPAAKEERAAETPTSLGEDPERAVDRPSTSAVAESEHLIGQTSAAREAPDSPTSTAKTSKRDSVELTGAFVVIDAAGQEHRDVSGSFTISGSRSLEARAERGTWRATISRADAEAISRKPSLFEIGLVHFGPIGGAEVLRPREKLTLRELQGLEILVRPAGTWLLSVRDSESGDDLDGIEFAIADPMLPMRSESHPGFCYEARALGGSLRSPVDWVLATAGRSERIVPGQVLVRARGHAWTLVPATQDHSKGIRVLLEPSGDVELTFEGSSRAPDASVRMATGSEPHLPIFDCPLESRNSARVGGLRPGRYIVRVEVGVAWRNPQVLASAECEVEADRTSRVSIAVPRQAEIERASASGVVRLPRAWGTWSLHLEIRSREVSSDPKAVQSLTANGSQQSDGTVAFPWKFDELPIGSYDLIASELSVFDRFEVPAGGLEGHEFRVRDPALLRVRILDAATRESLRKLEWRLQWAKSDVVERTHMIGGSGEPRFDAASDSYEIRTTPGEVWLHVSGYVLDRERIVFEVPDTQVTLLAQRVFRLSIEFKDRVAPPELDIPEPEVIAEGHGGKRTRAWRSHDGWSVEVDAPGAYRIQFAPLAGYAPIAERRIEISPEAIFEEVRVEVQRP